MFSAPTCRQIVVPENGYIDNVKEVYVLGDFVRFTCFKNFRLVGHKKLACQPNGKWNHNEPRCEREF